MGEIISPQTALDMLRDLTECRLTVCLIPSNVPECAADGGMIRVAVDRNPKWYRELCAKYPRSGRPRKKPRTIIKRREIIRILERLTECRTVQSKYIDDIAEIANGGIEEWNDQF